MTADYSQEQFRAAKDAVQEEAARLEELLNAWRRTPDDSPAEREAERKILEAAWDLRNRDLDRDNYGHTREEYERAAAVLEGLLEHAADDAYPVTRAAWEAWGATDHGSYAERDAEREIIRLAAPILAATEALQ